MTDLSKSAPRIAGMFDAIAGRYDFLNHFLSAGIDRRWRKTAIRALELTGRERFLDVCTGTADLALAARTARPGAAHVVGLDFAGAMLRVGLDKIRRGALDGSIQLVRGDAMHMPVATASVDAAAIAFGIRNVEDPAAACREMHRVLAAGGRLAILEFAVPANRAFRWVYMTYFRYLLPRIGRMLSRHDAAYEYLPASVSAFASPEEFANLLRGAGFGDVAARSLTFGAVMLYTARRPAGRG